MGTTGAMSSVMPVDGVLVRLPELQCHAQNLGDVLLLVADRQARIALHQVRPAPRPLLDGAGHAARGVGGRGVAGVVAPLQLLVQRLPEDSLDVVPLLDEGRVPPEFHALQVGLAVLAPEKFGIAVENLQKKPQSVNILAFTSWAGSSPCFCYGWKLRSSSPPSRLSKS